LIGTDEFVDAGAQISRLALQVTNQHFKSRYEFVGVVSAEQFIELISGQISLFGEWRIPLVVIRLPKRGMFLVHHRSVYYGKSGRWGKCGRHHAVPAAGGPNI
jgi:hypothetical protein